MHTYKKNRCFTSHFKQIIDGYISEQRLKRLLPRIEADVLALVKWIALTVPEEDMALVRKYKCGGPVVFAVPATVRFVHEKYADALFVPWPAYAYPKELIALRDQVKESIQSTVSITPEQRAAVMAGRNPRAAKGPAQLKAMFPEIVVTAEQDGAGRHPFNTLYS